MRFVVFAVGLLLFADALPAAMANEPDSQAAEFFETAIRPLLVNHCFECHGQGRTKGGLSLESSDGVLQGGDSGPAVVPGKPDESYLLEVVGYLGDVKMPPKERLSDGQIADLRRWIELGAPWPMGDAAAPASEPVSEFVITPEARAFWAFQPIQDPPPPPVRNASWPQDPIDYFVLAELEQRGLAPSARADRRTLIRRATFDLIGLPPTPAEVEAFVNDPSEEAFGHVVDRLLASPHYGERWGRHWLDVARYGEDQAHTFEARQYPNGFRYRDWVIAALNCDLPYDRFVVEQIVGDLLDEAAPAEDSSRAAGAAGSDGPERLIALGFFALGPVYYSDAGCAAKAALDELDDRVDTLSRGFLGLTVACARCHDHKFDPISQRDYYALAGIFSSTRYREAPLVPPDVVERYEQGQAGIKRSEEALSAYLAGHAARLAEAAAASVSRYLVAVWTIEHPGAGQAPQAVADVARQEGLDESILERWHKFLAGEDAEPIRAKLPQLAAWSELAGDATLDRVNTIASAFQADVAGALARRDQLEREYAEAVAAAGEAEKDKVARPQLEAPQAELLKLLLDDGGICHVPADRVESLLGESERQELARLKQQLDTARAEAPAIYAAAHSLVDGEAADMKLHIRGQPDKTGATVPRRFLAILSGDDAPFTQGSGRLELARAIASRENPLTARVIVNRVWQQHFGRGLVGTPSNFGELGERPTHPLLLDHLATSLINQGWSLKALHRKIMLSATYQQVSDSGSVSGSAEVSTRTEIDADNRFLWRMNRRRLDVEAWRDALLAVSGNLDRAAGGPSLDLDAPDNRRRTVYGKISRHNLDSLLRLFDFPDPNITSDQRTVTTVPLQQLFVLNSEFMVQQSRALAARLAAHAADDAARIGRAFELLYARPPTDVEIELGLEFLSGDSLPAAGTADAAPTLSRWEQYCQVLLSANEFLYVD